MQTKQSALPTELPGRTSRQGQKSTIQHNATASKPQITLCGTQDVKSPQILCPKTSVDVPLQFCVGIIIVTFLVWFLNFYFNPR